MANGSTLRLHAGVFAALLTVTLAAPGAAQQGEDTDSADAPTGPRSCLPQAAIRRTKILNNRNIVFVTRHEEIYNNELPKECPNLNRRSLVNYGVANRRICAGDRFQVLWENSPGNYLPAALCPLGNFVPITESELEDLTAMTEESRERRRRGRSSREAVTTEQVELPQAETAPAPVEAAPAE